MKYKNNKIRKFGSLKEIRTNYDYLKKGDKIISGII